MSVGTDCSINILSARWEQVITAPLPNTLTLSTLARGSHSAAVWRDYMLVYGGYRFPASNSYYRLPLNETVTETVEVVSILRYHFATKSWDEVETYPSMNGEAPGNNSTNDSMSEDLPGVPGPRYGHTAVVYNVRCVLIWSTIQFCHIWGILSKLKTPI